MSRWWLAVMALLLGAGLGLRAPRLTLRPLHNDEGVNAMVFRHLYVTHDYKYNPDEFHGPTLPYLTLPAAWLQGAGDFNSFTEATYRSVPVVFGLGLILIVALLARDFGRAEILWAAALTALSPAMVFYSRYYIHEMLLVFFTAGSFICFWRWTQSGRAAWALAGGLGLGLMFATKETFVFALAALALAIGTCALWGRWRKTEPPPAAVSRPWPHLLAASVIAVAVALLFFSSFFGNAAGPLDAVRTYAPWFRRAGGATSHVHPWHFYFHRLLLFHVRGGPYWSEAFILTLAAIGFVAALRGTRLLPRLVAFYTLYLTLIYTMLPYKTPWCLLGFYHGMILLAGLGAALLCRSCRGVWPKTALALILAAGLVHLGWQSARASMASDASGVAYGVSEKNPYVYSQTLPDALRLIANIEDLARVSPQGYGTVIEVMTHDSYWPLPWYLRRFQNIGYWDKIPAQPLAPIVIASTDLHAAFDEGPSKTHLMAGYFELRPRYFLELYVNTNLWTKYVRTLPPEQN